MESFLSEVTHSIVSNTCRQPTCYARNEGIMGWSRTSVLILYFWN